MSLARYEKNPILTRKDIPDIPPYILDPTSVFNPGAVKYKGCIKLMLRVQTRGRRTYLCMAESTDGFEFQVCSKVVRFNGFDRLREKVFHVYDPRITEIDRVFYVIFAMDMNRNCLLGLARTTNFEDFDFIGIVSDEPNRNGVLFSERIGGLYTRLDRPNRNPVAGDISSGSRIVLSTSLDMVNWRSQGTVIAGRHHYWDEDIGAGPPPIKTREGWILLYHGIARHFDSVNIYQAGVILMDLKTPLVILGRSRNNILEPRAEYELIGQVPNVVFPSGIIVDEYDDEGFAKPDSRVLVYYGAADTSVAVATTTVRELIDLARND